MAKYQVIAQPRNSFATDSWEFAVQTLRLLKTGYEYASISEAQFNNTLEEAEKYRIFERLPDPEHPYGNLDAMLQAEIGASKDEAKKRKLERNGGDRRSKNFQGNNVTLKRGNSAEYFTARIARDRPDLHSKILNGELSPHSAMIEAGFRQKTLNVPLDPAKAAGVIKRHFNRDQIVELIDHLM
jgi:hypothetical protein